MGFIKNALMGIALYEAVKYFLRQKDQSFDFAGERVQDGTSFHQQLRGVDIDIIAGARQTDQLKRAEENASSSEASADVSGSSLSSRDSGDDLIAGTNPETPLTGQGTDEAEEDPWKNSLANDELRAPDS